MINVHVTEEAKEYLKQKTNAVTVQMELCGG